MQIKRYEAANIKDILVRIKRELGPDAIVLSTKQLSGGGAEVLAAVDGGYDKTDLPPTVPFREENDDAGGEDAESFSLRKEIGEIKRILGSLNGRETRAALADLKEGMEAFWDLSGFGIHEKDSGNVVSRVYSALVDRGLSRSGAVKLMAEANRISPLRQSVDLEQGLKAVEETLKSKLAINKQEGKRVRLFLGPTGVGKTTTLAKLAARYAFQQKKSVGLITTDTYRIGAVEQLKTYAQIIDLPLEVADSKRALRRSLDHFRDKDCILIDTPGRGGRNVSDYLGKLKDMIAGETDVDASLLLSVTASRENMIDVADGFSEFGCDRVIFTKLDECAHLGILYDVMEKIGKPVAYLATGQNVPQDIEKANPERLARLILGHHC
jgi:flagellar biosynthesis protein FlhF